MKKKIGVLVALFLIIGVSPGWSLCCGSFGTWVNDQASSKSYPVKVGGMFLRGVTRIATSPGELFYHIYDGSVHHTENGVGVLKGIGSGLLWTVDSALRGGWDIVTALFPDYNGEPGTHDLGAEIGGK